MSALIKVGDTWVDPSLVGVIAPARDWSLDDGKWVIDAFATRLTLHGRDAILHVGGITPELAALAINGALLERQQEVGNGD